MSHRSESRALRSLDALVRIRKLEENKALEKVANSKAIYEAGHAHLEALKGEHRAALRCLECGASAGDALPVTSDGLSVIQRRAFLEQLRLRQKAKEVELTRLRREWASYQEGFCEARSRRKVSESLRDKHRNDLEEQVSETLENQAESDASRTSQGHWLRESQP